MKISRVVIDHSAFTLIALLILLLVGLLSFMTMPRSEDPQFDFSSVSVTVIYPGVSPEDLESLVVDPLEEEINALDDVKRIETNVRDGVVGLVVEFLYDTDPEDVFDDVQQTVTALRPSLPSGITDIDIRKLSPTEVNVLQLALVSEQSSYLKLEQLADDLKRGLERLTDVKRVRIWGVPRQQIEVALDWQRMAALGISAGQVAEALEQGSRNLAGGFVNAGSSRYSVTTSGDYSSLQQLRQSAIHADGHRIVQLQQIASVQPADAEDTHIARLNGQRAVFVTVTQRKSSNIFQLRQQIERLLKEYRAELPAAVSLEVAFDQAPSVDRQVNGFFDNLYQGLILVGLLVIAVLGFRSALVVMLAIPSSLLIAIGWLDLSGFGLQQMTIVGLIVALGLLVDNAIVLTESIGRAAQEGYVGMQAAYEGSRRVGWAVISGTLTTALAFLPMLLLPNNTGSFMRSMPATVMLTLFASLLVALTLSSLLAGRFLSGKKRKLPPVQLGLQRFADTHYRKLLQGLISRPWWTLLLGLLILVFSVSLVPKVGVSLFPKAEKPLLLVDIELPQNSNIYKTGEVTAEVSDWISKQPSVAAVVENIGADNPRIYYNERPQRAVANQAQIMVKLEHYQTAAIAALINNWRDKFAAYPGARIFVKELPHTATGKLLKIQLRETYQNALSNNVD